MPQGLRNVRTNRWLWGKFSSFWMEVLAKDMGILQGFGREFNIKKTIQTSGAHHEKPMGNDNVDIRV